MLGQRLWNVAYCQIAHWKNYRCNRYGVNYDSRIQQNKTEMHIPSFAATGTVSNDILPNGHRQFVWRFGFHLASVAFGRDLDFAIFSAHDNLLEVR